MRQNVLMPKAQARLRAIPPSASPEEAAAIVAAIERFMRATATHDDAPDGDPWREAALLEGVSRDCRRREPAHPWINT